MTLQEKYKQVREALRRAQSHLEYCSYGDAWERECADATTLPEIIKKALDESDLEVTAVDFAGQLETELSNALASRDKWKNLALKLYRATACHDTISVNYSHWQTHVGTARIAIEEAQNDER